MSVAYGYVLNEFLPRTNDRLHYCTDTVSIPSTSFYPRTVAAFKILSFSKSKSVFSIISLLSPQPKPMAYNTPASNDKTTCTDYVYFGKWQERRGQFAWSKNDLKNFGCKTQNFQESQKQRYLTSRNFYSGIVRYQQTDAIEVLAVHCSKKI